MWTESALTESSTYPFGSSLSSKGAVWHTAAAQVKILGAGYDGRLETLLAVVVKVQMLQLT